jgi:hypothetical protein
MPWSTSFERGFCDYAPPLGFCYAFGNASYRIVTTPVHSGHYAAAHTVSSDPDASDSTNSRCVRNGAFPSSAYYGAWYYVPEVHDNTGLWNLVHFQGGIPGEQLHGLWDLSLVNDGNGGLRVVVFDFLESVPGDMTNVPSIPIGAWFHLQFYWKRAADATGEVTVYQDGVVGWHQQDLVTDDTQWGQWYVGNLADENALQPPESTVYVDDVTISETP